MKRQSRTRRSLPPTLSFFLTEGVFLLALLIGLRLALFWRRERKRLRRELGDEQFFAAFPKERKQGK